MRRLLFGAQLIAPLPGGISGKPTQSKSDFHIGEITTGLVTLMHQDGFTHISQAIGANFRR